MAYGYRTTIILPEDKSRFPGKRDEPFFWEARKPDRYAIKFAGNRKRAKLHSTVSPVICGIRYRVTLIAATSRPGEMFQIFGENFQHLIAKKKPAQSSSLKRNFTITVQLLILLEFPQFHKKRRHQDAFFVCFHSGTTGHLRAVYGYDYSSTSYVCQFS